MSLPFDPFADMNLSTRSKCENGYTLDDLSQTMHSVYCKLVGDNAAVANQPWHALSEAHQEMWRPVAHMAMCLLDLRDEHAEVTISVSQTAKNFYRQFTASCSSPEFETLPEYQQVTWQALVRHMANLIDSDGKVDITDAEERIVAWGQAKIGSGPQLVLS